MENKIEEIIKEILTDNGIRIPDSINESSRLREDLGLDSLMLATLTVHIEEEFDVDVFEDGLVTTLGEVYEKLK